MTTKTARITVSLPLNLIAVAKEIADEKRLTRSRLVSMCLQELAEKRKSETMKDGYMAMAKQHEEFARMTSDVLHETIPEWK